MFSFFTFGVEMIVFFVLLDFAIQQNRWVVIGVGILLPTFISLMSSSKSSENENVVKQGSYGKVVIHKESLIYQLLHPREIWAMIRCKFGGVLSSKGLSLGLESYSLDDQDVEFCSVKLKKVSRSFATVITFLPNTPDKPLRLAVAIFYLVLRALDTVEDDMDLSRFNDFIIEQDKCVLDCDARLVAKQRILRTFALRMKAMLDDDKALTSAPEYQYLHDLGEGDERELLENLAIIIRVMKSLPEPIQEVILSITEEMGEGMAEYIARDLRNGTEDEDDFEHYCHVAAGTVGDGLTRLFAVCDFAPRDLVIRRDLWDSMGSFLQRTNIIRDYLEDLVDGRAWWPRTVWEKFVIVDKQQAPKLSMLAQVDNVLNGKSVQCLDHMIADALELVPRCLEYLSFLNEASVLSFCALPQVMAIATLAELYGNPKVFQGVVKIRKGQAARIMLDLYPDSHENVEANYIEWFKRCTKSIQTKNMQEQKSVRVDKLCCNILNLLDNPPKKQISTKRRSD